MLATEDYRAILGQADLGFSERLEIVKFIHWPVSSLTWGGGRSKGSKRMLTSELLLTVQLGDIAPVPEHGLRKIRGWDPTFPCTDHVLQIVLCMCGFQLWVIRQFTTTGNSSFGGSNTFF